MIAIPMGRARCLVLLPLSIAAHALHVHAAARQASALTATRPTNQETPEKQKKQKKQKVEKGIGCEYGT